MSMRHRTKQVLETVRRQLEGLPPISPIFEQWRWYRSINLYDGERGFILVGYTVDTLFNCNEADDDVWRKHTGKYGVAVIRGDAYISTDYRPWNYNSTLHCYPHLLYFRSFKRSKDAKARAGELWREWEEKSKRNEKKLWREWGQEE